MKISYNWLKEYIDFSESPEKLGDILTQTGLEVEGIEKAEKIPGGLKGIVVGEVMSCEQHPNADKLKVTKVDIGASELSDIVCGAPNVATGQKVLVATVNSTIHPTNGEPFKIKKAKIRGEVSEGMICAEDELGLGTSHEGIMVLDTDKPNGTPAIELFETGEDHIFEIGLTPNRGDATSHMGSARDLKAYFRKELNIPQPKSFDIKEDQPISVRIEDHDRCPRFSGITIRGLKVQSSPDWLQWKLRSIGLEPINNVVDVTNYVLHSLGQPMHAYDAALVKGDKIIVKTLEDKTSFTTLEGKERKLSKEDLMVCNGAEEGMCMAGVLGGLKSGVTEETTAIFLESAYWNADGIRSTAQRHTISTDASFRYERGADPEITVAAVKLGTSLILELAGGYAASEIVDIYPEPIKEKEIEVTFQHFHWLIGKTLDHKLIIEILNWLDIKTENVTETGFKAIVPAYRSDVTRPADLVEEVLRIYGFNEVELDEDFSSEYLAEFNEHEPYRVQEDLSKFLAGQGYSEILTNSLTNPKYYEKFPIGGEPVEMLNPSSEELTIMKTSPVYTALESVAYNINRRNPNLKFFEFGRSYKKEDQKYKETEWLSFYLTGNTKEANWLDEPRKNSFHDLSTTVMGMLKYSGIRKTEIIPSEKGTLYEYGVVIKKEGKMLGILGKLKKELLSIYGIKQDVFHAQLDWEAILSLYKSDIAYEPIPKFPEVKRDLSLVLDKNVSYADIQQLAFKQEKKLLNRMNLFSVYEGDKIEKGKKAYAISFFLQDKFKTLTDKQIDKSMNALMSLYEKQLGAVIRK
ncbi:phenylalanyl-tRNA synthetase beta subunit [Ekhidna lutea]|uniref:Phenylalanine--tRNA ligase beta subunit n=1 Tax=Ekhidna lutea TaxID=447679 RepID=A0A239KRW3_EKHLU|nr:phenylalanine--tRNA ligase subunit beta [Ekhidna lutea]SNT20269.1 phenylalanyl-tRNA synthetase beta subunit [Ekhidna lutea]